MSLSRWWAAVFMALVVVRTGVSMEAPGAGFAGAAILLVTPVLRRRPLAPTPGLSFILLATGALLGYLALGDLMPEQSWAASYPLPGGVALAVVALLAWVLAAHPGTRPGHVGAGATQTLLVGGLAVLSLLPLPPQAGTFGQALLPAGIAAAVAALVAGRGAAALRVALAAPVLILAPLAVPALGDAPRPLVRLLWSLAPEQDRARTGYDPRQPLRALAFLRPSDRPVARVQLRGPAPAYLAGNRFSDLDAGYTWRPAAAQVPEPRADDPDWQWYALGSGTPAWAMQVEPLEREGPVLAPLGAQALGTREASLAAGSGGVLELRFAEDAPRMYRVRGGAPPTEPRARALGLPPFWDDELDAAATALGAGDAAATAARVGAFLRARRYSFDTRLDPERPFHDFFLSGKPAYCFWYATGAVLALRANGVPARVAGGYVVSERLAGNTYIVRARDAHAWTEWQDEAGRWHTLDPTPPSEAAFYDAYAPGPLRRTSDRLTAAWARASAWLHLSDAVQNTLIAAGLGGLAFLFQREYRRLRASPATVAGPDRRLRRMWRRFLRRAHLPEEPTWTCAHYAGRLPAEWSPARREAARAFLGAYGPARFGAPSGVAIEPLETALRRFEETP